MFVPQKCCSSAPGCFLCTGVNSYFILIKNSSYRLVSFGFWPSGSLLVLFSLMEVLSCGRQCKKTAVAIKVFIKDAVAIKLFSDAVEAKYTPIKSVEAKLVPAITSHIRASARGN